MLSPTLGDDRLGRRDDLEADHAALAAALDRIDHLERQVGSGTVDGLRYAWFPTADLTARLVCVECPDAPVVGVFAWGARHAVVQDAIVRHNRVPHPEPEQHDDGGGAL